MAQWSEAEIQKRLREKNATLLEERKVLFKKFRDGGWSIKLMTDVALLGREKTPKEMPDDWIGSFYFKVKMPGAAEMEINTVAQLHRLVKGV